MAGEVIAVGEAVKDWKVGERVCSNFAIDHVSGDITAQSKASSLGGAIYGVLTEYKVLPAHVSRFLPPFVFLVSKEKKKTC